MTVQHSGADNEFVLRFASSLLAAVANSTRSDGLGALIELGRQALENPFAITDKAWKAIAMTAGSHIPDDIGWAELETNGYLSAETVAAGMRDKLAERIEESEAPFVWQGSGMKYPRMLKKISLGGKTAATISVVEYDRPFNAQDSALLDILANAVAAEMQKNTFQQFTRGMLYENFIENLLEGRLRDPKVIDERVRLLNIGIKKYIYLFVFDVTDFDTKQYTVPYMRDVLEKMISGGQALIYDNKIVIASSFTRSRDIFNTELQNLGEFLRRYNIRCGISRRCTQLSELRFYYDQALDALRIGTYMDSDRYIYPYGQYAAYHIAELCRDAGGSGKFCHPALITLLEHDNKYHTSFTGSLHAYLSHFRNISEAAKFLHIHRSTMVYHLRRIGEIMDIDLNDFNASQLIELSFRLLEYEKKLELRPAWNGAINKEN
jgi:sugar diacid utilization regulator